MRIAILAAVFLAAPVLAAEDKPVVKEIATKDLKVTPARGGKPIEPATIGTAEELAKSPVVGGEADAIKKQIDFAKEKLLVFAWAGSGQDAVAVTGETKDGKPVVTVAFTPGRTRDLRQHVKLFVVPKAAEVTVKGK